MENKTANWLLIASQAVFLLSSLIEPPSGLLMILLRVLLPIFVILYLSLIVAGVIAPRKR